MAVGRYLVAQILGNALSFNGSTSGCKRTLISNSTGDFTACAWIYLSATPSGTKTILKNGRTGLGNGGWNFSITSASKLNLSDPGGVWGGTATTALSNTTWYHVAFIRSGSSTQMYINAVADGSAVSGTFNSPESFTTVGCIWNDSSNTFTNIFNGYIDDARIYTRALTLAELTLIYQRDVINYPSTSNLLGWWKFDESSGDSADSSGNSNTMTVTNATYVAGNAYTANVPARTTTSSRSTSGVRTLAS